MGLTAGMGGKVSLGLSAKCGPRRYDHAYERDDYERSAEEQATDNRVHEVNGKRVSDRQRQQPHEAMCSRRKKPGPSSGSICLHRLLHVSLVSPKHFHS